MSQAKITYMNALHRNENLFASIGLRDNIPSVLDAEEEVYTAVPGTARNFPYVLMATSRRVILAQVGGLTNDAVVKREVPAPQVASVAYRPGLFTRVVVELHQGRPIKIGPNARVNGERFARELHELLLEGSGEGAEGR